MKPEEREQLFKLAAETLATEIRGIEAAALAARDAATGEESRAEDKHDTRAIEASYLAAGQSRRAHELTTQRRYFLAFEARLVKPGPATEGHLVRVREADTGRRHVYLLSRVAGGLVFRHGGESIQVLSLSSPLGEALVGAKAGDSVEAEVRDRSVEYSVDAIE